MKNILSNALFFTAGAVIGSVVTWKLVKTKYEQISREEIESVREMYESLDASKNGDVDSEDDEEDPDNKNEYGKIINNSGYIKLSTDKRNDKEEEEEGDDDMIEPYVIIPEEFDEVGYETMTLTYYDGDGVLAYGDTDEVIEDVGELVCEDFADHFGEYDEDPDVVYVRNDNLRIDFEILKDTRSYSEVN